MDSDSTVHPPFLTSNQETFVRVYNELDNASEAHRQAYPKSRKWKESSVNANAHKLLKKPKIQQRLTELRAHARKTTEVTVERIVKRLAAHAFTSLSDISTLKGNRFSLEDWENLTSDQKAAVKKVRLKSRRERDADGEYSVVEYIEVEPYDQQKALDLLGRHLGMFTEKHEIDVAPGLNIILDLAGKRKKPTPEPDD